MIITQSMVTQSIHVLLRWNTLAISMFLIALKRMMPLSRHKEKGRYRYVISNISLRINAIPPPPHRCNTNDFLEIEEGNRRGRPSHRLLSVIAFRLPQFG